MQNNPGCKDNANCKDIPDCVDKRDARMYNKRDARIYNKRDARIGRLYTKIFFGKLFIVEKLDSFILQQNPQGINTF